MRAIVQRSKKSSVKVESETVGAIDYGMVILVGFTEGDTEEIIEKMVKKIINLRIFNDDNGIMNKSILEVDGSILSISQFTLYANTKKGNRPSYIEALNSEVAIKLYNLFNEKLREHINVSTGIFGADMEVNIINDGPITIALDSN
ncbi:MAG: D-tyrosyl-tRNA(Tyr) deacylase [Bacilli bacterium]|nr:D-tyrosyl-tRNA(Tyr) deacylase [Bacilli bacterium]